MIKVTSDKLQPGMRLAKPIMITAGMALLDEGTELTETWVARIQDMDLEGAICVEGRPEMDVPIEEMLAGLERRFQSAHGNQKMEIIKRAAERLSITRQIQGRLDNDDIFALAHADLDNFKPFNDRRGFGRGDELIKMTGRIILTSSRAPSHRDAS